ncbi:MAG: hypothetical protein JNK05_19610 [Myxococcales bacterium]|nr:hypothetical protein [Myxococcales bacterium]
MATADTRRLIRPRLDRALVDAAIDSLDARFPSDRIVRGERGWIVRDDAPWFLLFAAVALVLLAGIAHTGAARAAGFPRSLRALPWLLDAGWIACAATFFRRFWGACAISLREQTLVFEWTFRGRVLRAVTVDAEDVQAVRLAGERTVTLEGPRNQVLATPYVGATLDPPWLSRWHCEAVASLCERALSR